MKVLQANEYGVTVVSKSKEPNRDIAITVIRSISVSSVLITSIVCGEIWVAILTLGLETILELMKIALSK